MTTKFNIFKEPMHDVHFSWFVRSRGQLEHWNISVRETAHLQSIGDGQSFVRCICKMGCARKTCKCVRSDVCTSRCHNSNSYQNKSWSFKYWFLGHTISYLTCKYMMFYLFLSFKINYFRISVIYFKSIFYLHFIYWLEESCLLPNIQK